jgi:dCMP deaminase
MKEKYKQFFMSVATEVAKLSHCNRLKVGSVIVKDNNVLSLGYNGTPAGFDNCCEENGVTKNSTLHAERNSLIRLARSTESSVGASMFLTHAPCQACSVMIISAGIKEVYYKDVYRDMEGIRLLKQADIYVEEMK